MPANGAADPSPPPASLSRILMFGYITVGIAQACGSAYITLMPYVWKSHQGSPVTLGYLNSIGALGQLFVSPQLGKLGDTFGARAVMMAGCISMAMCHVTTGLAWGLVFLFLGRMFAIAQDPKPGMQILVADLVPGKTRSVAMSKLALPAGIGMFVGPALAGQVAKYFGEQRAFLITWLCPLMSCFLLLGTVPAQTRSLLPPTHNNNGKKADTPKRGFISYFKDEDIRSFLMIKLMTSIPFLIMAQNMAIIGLTTFKLTPQMNGIVLSWNGVNFMLAAFVFGRLSKTFSDDQLLKIAPFVSLFAYFIISQMTSVWFMLVAIVPWNLANVVIENQVLGRITHMVPSTETGAIVGVNASIFHFCRILGPVVGGLIIQYLGVQAIGYLGMFINVVLIAYCYNRSQKDSKQI